MLTGSCHCGKTTFEVDGEIPEKLVRCTCSSCAKKGALYAYYAPEQFRLTSPKDDGATYRWQTKQVGHNFCATCGCSTSMTARSSIIRGMVTAAASWSMRGF